MMTHLMTAMKTSISEVMETMFFLPVEFLDDTPLSQTGLDDMDAVMACELTFSGPSSGKLTLVIPRDLLAEMTENFIGESKKDNPDPYLEGTLKEALNMICGNMLGRVKTDTPFELGIPLRIDSIDSQEPQDFTLIETIGSKLAIRLLPDGSA